MSQPFRLGTRGSKLALTQSTWVARELEQLGHAVTLTVIRTTGDLMQSQPEKALPGKGVFVKELEQALLDGEIDLAVHSMKDLPPESPEGLVIAAVPAREDPRDVLAAPAGHTLTLATLPTGARLATSSARRRAQLLARRPDLQVLDIRGNVDTRLRKLDEGQYDAICLAAAGLRRLGLEERITEYLNLAIMLPAAGQGALAIQTRADDACLRAALAPLHDEPTTLATRAERTVLEALNGGCSIPLGVYAQVTDNTITLTAALCSLDGAEIVRETINGLAGDPEGLGQEMGTIMRARGRHLLP